MKQNQYFLTFLTIILLLPVLLALGSCSVSDPAKDKPLVVTTIFPPYDFARNVAGDNARIDVLVTVTDSHSFSPSAADMALIEECDLFIYTGGDGDVWAEDFLAKIDTSEKTVINLMELCRLVESDHHHDHEGHDHSHGQMASYDEHVWMDPYNAMGITEAICDALCKMDPDSEGSYRSNTESYLEALTALDEAYRQRVAAAEDPFLVVADRFPYRYLCDAYGISYVSAIDGCGSASDLAAIRYDELVTALQEHSTAVILCTEYSDRTVAQTVLRECGMEDVVILSLHSCHTLTEGAIREGNTYLSLMQENLRILSTALG